MVGFITKSGDRYYADTENHHITGGILNELDDIAIYKRLSCIIGMPAAIKLINGNTVRTSPVVEYFTVKNV